MNCGHWACKESQSGNYYLVYKYSASRQFKVVPSRTVIGGFIAEIHIKKQPITYACDYDGKTIFLTVDDAVNACEHLMECWNDKSAGKPDIFLPNEGIKEYARKHNINIQNREVK